MLNKFDNLDSKQLSAIIHLVVDEQDSGLAIDEPAHAELIGECLNKPFMRGQFQERVITEIPKMLQKSFILDKKNPLSGLILDEKTPLLELKRAKSFFNDASKHEKDPVRKEVYIALYYAFIAAALLHCKKKITEHPASDLHRYLMILLKKSWIPGSLQEIFRQACDYLAEIQLVDTKN